MPLEMTVVVAACSLLFVILTVGRLRFAVRRTQGVISLVALFLYLAVLHFAFGFPSFPIDVAKGESEAGPGPLILALFLFMLLGMGAEYLYQYLDAGPGRTTFDWRSFVKPFVISPLVFVPLAASLQNARVDLSRFDIPILMLFLVAFENGFLWRGYFTRKLAQP